jgi:two-component system sensor histidine kinase RegB
MNEETPRIGLARLVPLRWLLLAGQILAVAVAATSPGIDLDVTRASACIAVTVISNLTLAFGVPRRGIPPRGVVGGVLLLDTGVLTLLLQAGGGPSNPFSVLYLVHITLASLLLGTGWTLTITVMSILGFGLLFLGGEHAHHMGEEFSSHLRGMWLAFSLTAGLTAAFVLQLTEAIRKRDREIERIREHADRNDRLAALTTLAAGAAHELGSPLATIAVAAGELDRAVTRMPADQAAAVRDDAKLILDQLARCREIIDQMTAAAGEVTGEAPERVSLERLVETVRASLRHDETSRLLVELALETTVSVPYRALARAVSSLVRNAFDASPANGTVRLTVAAAGAGRLSITVVDEGEGMQPDTLARATDPFYTTKAPGHGMGMGLFLARALVERIGGSLTLASTPGRGTSASLDLPLDSVGPARSPN